MKQKMISMLLATSLSLVACISGISVLNVNAIDTISINNETTETSNAGFYIVNGVLEKYYGAGGVVTVPAGVEYIVEDAFRDKGQTGNETITELILPEGLKWIERDTFNDFRNLQKIILPSTLKEVPYFAGCEKLKEINIPEGIEELNASFADCKSLETITIPSSVKKIDCNVFLGCTNLRTIILPDTLEEVSASSFKDTPWLNELIEQTEGDYIMCQHVLLGTKTPLSEIIVPEGTISIAPEAFKGQKNIEKVVFPSSVKFIAYQAFYDCTNLHTVKFKGVENIDVFAFGNTGIKELVLPSGLKKIQSYAFHGCNKLSTIKLPDTLEEIEESAFGETNVEEITFSKSVKKIGVDVLKNCPRLKKVTILNKQAKLFERMGSATFYTDCEYTLLGGPDDMSWNADVWIYVDKKTKRTVTVRGYKYSTAQEMVDSQKNISRYLGYKTIRFEAIDPEASNKVLESVKVPETLTITKEKGKKIKVTLPKGVKSVKKFTKGKGQVKITYKIVDDSVIEVNQKGKVTYFTLPSGKEFNSCLVYTTVTLPDGKCKVFTTKVKVK